MTLTVSPVEIVRELEASSQPGLLARHPTWPRVPLKTVISIQNGAPFKSTFFNKTRQGLPLLRIRDVGVNGPDTYYNGPFEAEHLVNQGDIIVGMDGDFRVGRWAGPESLLNQRVCRLTVTDGRLDERWLLHCLPGYLEAIWNRTSSVTVKHLSSRTIGEIPLPLPPIEEQWRIVDTLEDHLSRLDATDKYHDAVTRKVELACESIHQAAVSGRLVGPETATIPARDALLEWRRSHCPPDMKRGRPDAQPPMSIEVPWPSRWTTMSLEEVTHPVRTISYGILKPGPDIVGGVPYVRVVNMRNDRLDIDGLRRTTRSIANQYQRASLEGDDVLISIRGTYGRVVVVPESLRGANITQDTARLAYLPSVNPRFAAIALRSPFIQRTLQRVARGVAVKGVNIGDLRALPFPVPSPVEQERIVATVDELVAEARSAAAAVAVAGMRGGSLRRSLLQAAFAGRLVS